MIEEQTLQELSKKYDGTYATDVLKSECMSDALKIWLEGLVYDDPICAGSAFMLWKAFGEPWVEYQDRQQYKGEEKFLRLMKIAEEEPIVMGYLQGFSDVTGIRSGKILAEFICLYANARRRLQQTI